MNDSRSRFWENSFKNKQNMWGFEPAKSTLLAVDLFKAHQITRVLIPGFGYGRNGKVFYDNGMAVTGIEISATAINLAKIHYGETMDIHHGSVLDMPFDANLYQGIFCYALAHLLDEHERKTLIQRCHQQLEIGGYMVFVVLSKNSETYGEGIPIGSNTFCSKHGLNLFYYDEKAIELEFSKYGLMQTREVIEPSHTFYYITCKK